MKRLQIGTDGFTLAQGVVEDVVAIRKARAYARERVWVQAHSEHVHAYQKEYRARNAERLKSYHAEYHRAKQSDRVAARVAYLEANREALARDRRERKRTKDARWRRNHPETFRESIARAKAAKPEKYRLLNNERAGRRRSRKRAAGIEPVSTKAIIARDRSTCHLCRKPVESKDISIDHLIPVVRRGPWAEWNLALAHLNCNRRRRDLAVLSPEDRASAEAYIRRLSSREVA